MSSTISLLAGLVQGYTGEKARLAHEELAQRASQQQNMLQYLSHLASNPNVPPEHQQWAMGKIQELVQADPSKKLPKVDMAELPAVNVPAGPTRTATPPPVPAMTLQPPVGPGSQPMPSGNVGRASDSTVNALGASSGNIGQPSTIRPPMGPNPVATSSDPQFELAPPQPVTLPPIQQAQIANPTPPVPISPAGQIHLLTPEDRAKYPRPPVHENFTLTPGEKRYEDGKLVAENTDAKPGTKSGYEPVMGPGGPIGVKDVATGGMLSPTQVAANPQAKAVFEQATHEHAAQMKEAEAKDQRHAATQAAQQARAFAEQARLLEARQEALSGTTKTMVEAAPRVLELSARVREEIAKQQADLGPLSSRWSEFMSGKVGSPNPEFSKLRTDTGLLQTLLMRMHVGARGGEHMMGHFKEMIDSGKQSPENMTAALDEIDSYAKDVAKEGGTAKEAVAAKAEGREAKAVDAGPPEGASHEVYAADGKTLLGHAVNSKFVPLGQEKK